MSTPTGDVYVVGETERHEDPGNIKSPVIHSAFVLHFGPGGKFLGPAWIAPMLYGFESGAVGVSLTTEGDLLVAGWSRHAKGAVMAPMATCLGPAMELKCAWIGTPKSIDTEARRFLASPTGQLVLGVIDDDGGHPRARIQGLEDENHLGSPVWTTSAPLWIDDLGHHRLGDVTIDDFGDIHYVGTATNDDATVRQAFGGKIRG